MAVTRIDILFLNRLIGLCVLFTLPSAGSTAGGCASHDKIHASRHSSAKLAAHKKRQPSSWQTTSRRAFLPSDCQIPGGPIICGGELFNAKAAETLVKAGNLSTRVNYPLCWPVQAGWVFGSMSSFMTSPGLPHVEQVLCSLPSVITTVIS